VVSFFITVIIDNFHAFDPSTYLSLLPMWSLFLSFSLRCDIFFSLFSSPPEGEVGSADLVLLDSDGRVGVSEAWAVISQHCVFQYLWVHSLSTSPDSPVLLAVVARTVLSSIFE
jgi:hypothetical protein